MKKLVMWIPLAMVTAMSFMTAGCSESAVSRRDAKPEFGERLTNEAVKGHVSRIDGNYLWIREDGGKEVRAHVDDRTKMDKVVLGDRAKVYINENGHATTVQRLD
jgi:hypothetical protein